MATPLPLQRIKYGEKVFSRPAFHPSADSKSTLASHLADFEVYMQCCIEHL